METFDRVRRVATRLGIKAGWLKGNPDLHAFGIDPAEQRRMRQAPPTEVHRAFYSHGKRPAHKWAHYLDLYDRYLDRYRGSAVKMIEIGVFDGGSLEMWRRYFGPQASIVGIDINPRCADCVDPPNVVRIGSQADRAFLEGVVAEFGAPELILDDGSHIAKHQRASFEILFPLLQDGGLYIIEDTHTSYWNEWDGGYRRAGTAIEMAKSLVDDLHAWCHHKGSTRKANEDAESVHFHDSMVVIEKRRRQRPGQMSSEGGRDA
jgi:hypothetical protein